MTRIAPTKLVQKDEGESTLDTGEGIVAKFKRKRKKGTRDKIKRVPASPDAAIKQAQESLGRPLNQNELEETIKDFRKKKRIKKRKKKRKPKVKGMSGRITPTILPGIAGRSDTPARDLGSKINRKRKKTRKKKRRGGRGRR